MKYKNVLFSHIRKTMSFSKTHVCKHSLKLRTALVNKIDLLCRINLF